MIRIYNTLTRKKEIFKPLRQKRVNLFVCGPTVYDFAHIGHARTYIAFDIFARYLRHQGYRVFYLQNITDVDDKIIARSRERGIDPKTLAHDLEATYYEDMKHLGVTSVTKYARATDYILEIGSQAKHLIDKGYAYPIEQDGYYFDLKTFPSYGKLSGRTAEGAEDAVSRIDESLHKRNRGDFCLWKFSKSGDPSWKSKLGEGRPGWHIEDTAITESHFGPQYDIHGGARDLIFPHHEAEIAQMESISGKKPLARTWMHTGFLTVEGKKMSKSLGNFITIRDFLKANEPETLRMLVASAHYRSPIDYSEKAAQQAAEQLRRLREFAEKIMEHGIWNVERKNTALRNGILVKLKGMEEKFYKEMDDDNNTPKALAALLAFVRCANPLIDKGRIPTQTADAIRMFLENIDGIFGFNLLKKSDAEIPNDVQKIVNEREEARSAKDWQRADQLRGAVQKLGYLVEDTARGPRIKKQ